MDTLAILGFIIGIISFIITVIALFVSINIYNATGEYRGVKRYRLKNSLRIYLDRKTNPKATEFKKEKVSFRAVFLSYALLLAPSKLKFRIDKIQKKEKLRKEKNKKFSERLISYGFGGIIAFASNAENDYRENYFHRAIKQYIDEKNYSGLVLFVKTTFTVHGPKPELKLINIIIGELFWGIDDGQSELAGVLLYLYWYRLSIFGEKLPNGIASNLTFLYEKFNNKQFYEYFRHEYGKNINDIHKNRGGFGNFSAMYVIHDDKVTEFLMLLKYYNGSRTMTEDSEVQIYVDEKLGTATNDGLIELTQDSFKTQLDMVGGNLEMEPYILSYIKANT